MNPRPPGRLHPLYAAMLGLFVAPAGAETAAPVTRLPEVEVEGSADEPRYQRRKLSSPKATQPLVETPQTVNVITQEVLDEQGVESLRDALRNVTGISIQAGEGNPPAGDQLKIRGFSARDDIFVDGVRDPGNYFRDPFNVEQIEVSKGPASAQFGRGSTGGSINLVSKSPRLDAFTDVDITLGTDATKRTTVDFNQPLDGLIGAAVRVNLMGHDANVAGRDHVENQRWGIAPSLALGLGTDTRLIASYYHTRQDNLPDYGIPTGRNPSLAGSRFGGKVAPVDFDNFYGLVDQDYQDIQVDVATLSLEHDFSDSLSLRNQLRWGRTDHNSIFSAPRFVPGNLTTIDGTTLVNRSRKPRDQTDEIFANQSDLSFAFDTGAVRHTAVAGVEITRQTTENRRRLDVNGPTTSLHDPDEDQIGPQPVYNGTRAEVELDTLAAYAFDTIEFSEHWEWLVGARWDHVDTRVQGKDDSGLFPGFVTDVERTDTRWNGNTALVFKPVPGASVYAGYGTSFDPSGRFEVVQLAGGNNSPPVTAAAFNVAPERSRTWEVGGKWQVLDERLLLTAAVFRTDKTNARTPGEPGDPAVVLQGEQRVDGFELGAVGELTPWWNLLAGYTYLDSEIRRSNIPIEEGQDLDNTPRHTFTLWNTWLVGERLTLGAGAQFVDERTNSLRGSTGLANLPVTVDSYWLFDAMAAWRFSDTVTVRMNVLNLADEEYILELGGGQAVPGPGRAALFTAELSY